MFKRLLLAGLILVGGINLVLADDTTTETTVTETTASDTILSQINIASTLKNLSVNTEPSIFYSLDDHEADYLTQYTLVGKETSVGTFSLNAAYGSSNTLLGVLAYKTSTLEKLGVDMFLLKDLFASIGYGAGASNVSSSDREFDHGPIFGVGASIQFGS